jgi:uncharacterized protein (TIGR02145 family)
MIDFNKINKKLPNDVSQSNNSAIVLLWMLSEIYDFTFDYSEIYRLIKKNKGEGISPNDIKKYVEIKGLFFKDFETGSIISYNYEKLLSNDILGGICYISYDTDNIPHISLYSEMNDESISLLYANKNHTEKSKMKDAYYFFISQKPDIQAYFNSDTNRNEANCTINLPKNENIEISPIYHDRKNNTYPIHKFIDNRNNQSYRILEVKNTLWMIDNFNLKVENSWSYENNNINIDKYGRIYTWKSALKACPEGWRLPTIEDWKELASELWGVNDITLKFGSDIKYNILAKDSCIISIDDYRFNIKFGGIRVENMKEIHSKGIVTYLQDDIEFYQSSIDKHFMLENNFVAFWSRTRDNACKFKAAFAVAFIPIWGMILGQTAKPMSINEGLYCRYVKDI